MFYDVKCPYCKGNQNIEIDLRDYSEGRVYYDCEHCLECFSVVLKATTQQLVKQRGIDK